VAFIEYDVARDPEARARVLRLTGGTRAVPVIAAEGTPPQIGRMGAGCSI
jgi:glutaredoxin 3